MTNENAMGKRYSTSEETKRQRAARLAKHGTSEVARPMTEGEAIAWAAEMRARLGRDRAREEREAREKREATNRDTVPPPGVDVAAQAVFEETEDNESEGRVIRFPGGEA